jgi:hypothetical protein
MWCAVWYLYVVLVCDTYVQCRDVVLHVVLFVVLVCDAVSGAGIRYIYVVLVYGAGISIASIRCWYIILLYFRLVY